MRPFLAQETIACFSRPKSLGFWVAKCSRFAPLFTKKGLIWGRPGLETMKIEKDNISITYARPFSRTIPVRTPQSASRTEEFEFKSWSWMSRGLVADRRSYLRNKLAHSCSPQAYIGYWRLALAGWDWDRRGEPLRATCYVVRGPLRLLPRAFRGSGVTCSWE